MDFKKSSAGTQTFKQQKIPQGKFALPTKQFEGDFDLKSNENRNLGPRKENDIDSFEEKRYPYGAGKNSGRLEGQKFSETKGKQGRLAYALVEKKQQPKKEITTKSKGVLATGLKAPKDLSVEEKYIQNLQQQCYFLEMETKLLREKERERTAAGFFDQAEEFGDNRPLSENIISLKQKYAVMRKDLEEAYVKLTIENRELVSKSSSFEKTVLFLNQQLDSIKRKLQQATDFFEEEAEKYRKAVNKVTYEREEVSTQVNESLQERDLAKQMAAELKITNDKLINRSQVLEEVFSKREEFAKEILKEKDFQILQLQDELKRLQQQLSSDEKVQILQQNIDDKTAQLNEFEIDKNHLGIQMKTLEYSKQLVEKTLAQQTKELQETVKEIEDIKQQLEWEKMYQEGLIQQKLKEETSKQVQKIKIQLENTKKEALHQNEQYKIKVNELQNLVDDKNKLNFHSAELSYAHETLKAKYEALQARLSELDALWKESNLKANKNENQIQIFADSIHKHQNKNNLLAQENFELLARVQHLTKQNEVNQLAALEPEDFKKLAQQNTVNQTITNLMGKWDNIKVAQAQNVSYNKDSFTLQKESPMQSFKP